MPELRDYQLRSIQRCRESMIRGHKRVLLVCPTGSGKSATSLEIIRCTVEKGKRSIFLADRIQLVIQASNQANIWGVPHGILMAGHETDLTHLAQIGSKDTIYSRCFKRERFELPAQDLIVLDECHRGLNASTLATVNANPEAYVIGLTATPAGVNGKGLGDHFTDMVIGATYQELRDLGHLVPSMVYAPTIPDMSKVKKNADGDYIGVQAEAVMKDSKIIGDIWEHWNRLGRNRRTLVFASGVPHSIDLCAMFRARGITAEHADANTPDDERQEHLEAFKRGYIQVLCNYGLYDTGFDAPWCSCVIVARPTESLQLWRQMANRGGRPWDGLDENGNKIGEPKTDFLILDHGGNVYRHGYPDEDIPWTLNTGKRIEEIAAAWRASNGEREPIACSKCFAYRERGNICPKCGHKSQRKGKKVEHGEGTLGLVDRQAQEQKKTAQNIQKKWLGCLARMAYCGRTAAQARALMFKETNVWVSETVAVGPQPKEHEWGMPVASLYPGFIKRRASNADKFS